MPNFLSKFLVFPTVPPSLWTQRSPLTKLFILLTLYVVFLVTVFVSKNNIAEWTQILASDHDASNVKALKIAIWISKRHQRSLRWHEKATLKNIVRDQNRKHCFEKCEMKITQNLEVVKSADAVLFFMLNKGLMKIDMPRDWTKWRRPDQVWIVHAHETPPQTYNNNLLNKTFNWTISYRRDSDVWLPYGRVEPIDPNSQQQHSQMRLFGTNLSLSEWISGKSKLAVGVISNCKTHSKRENVIHRMKKTGKPVDIYGHCGKKVNCTFVSGNCTEFWNKLASQYKFYLAFENSICVDYISEKFWRSLELGMVPVVYGGADYSKLAPPGSYIRFNRFNSDVSVHRLMNFLEKVGENATKYAKYFDWRKKYKLVEGNSCWDNGNAWCELCEKLRTFKNLNNSTANGTLVAIKVKTVSGLWWNHKPKISNGDACVYH